MASTTNPQHEPTMEEILASIRKIISEDQGEPAKPAAPMAAPVTARAPLAEAPKPVAAPPIQADMLELTQEVQDDGFVSSVAMTASVKMEPMPAPTAVDVNDIAFETIEEAPPPSEAQVMPADDLISDSTRQAVGRAFESLDYVDDEEEAPMPMPPAGGNVETVFERAVRTAFEPVLQQWVDSHSANIVDQLKPLIRQWMDENLPSLIEGAVKKELDRVVNARGRRR